MGSSVGWCCVEIIFAKSIFFYCLLCYPILLSFLRSDYEQFNVFTVVSPIGLGWYLDGRPLENLHDEDISSFFT